MVKVKDILAYLNEMAPFQFQESYDNAGLIVGDKNCEVTGVLVALDALEKVLDEAIQLNYNVVLTHHPIVFKGLKRITGDDYIQRVVLKAIKNDIALIATHTNLDHVSDGVNQIICDRLGLQNTRILDPKEGLMYKYVVFVPETHKNQVLDAISITGAGKIGKYDSCSFSTNGEGRFRPLIGSEPAIGTVNQLESVQEVKIEVIVSKDKLSNVQNAVRNVHPYEEIAFDIIPMEMNNREVGAGKIGELPVEMDATDFLHEVKKRFNLKVIRHTEIIQDKIKKVAVCGGAGVFLLNKAKSAGADVFITADVKYHEFFDAENQLILADIGHFESEQFTSHWLVEQLNKKFTTFAVRLTKENTNPINYL